MRLRQRRIGILHFRILERVQAEQEGCGGSARDADEPKRVNPLLAEGTARLYYEILAEGAHRRGDLD
ncbi:unnamed protein product [Amoebophrya sp. A25]|nr:unnamed protein product [Amoebophrya sp. A25]|eukprot:GSA25T00001925001.1